MQKLRMTCLKRAYLVAIPLLVLLFSSCNGLFLDQDDVAKKEVTDISQLKAPEDFSWQTTQGVAIAIDVLGASEYKSKILVYNGNPFLGGDLLQTGSASAEEAFVSEIDVPAYLEKLYVVCEFPTGASRAAEVAISEGTLLYSFSEVESKKLEKRMVSLAPDCSTGCDREISGNISSLTIQNGETVCLTGSLVGGITFKKGGGTLRICGNAIVSHANYNGNVEANFIVTESGTLQSNNINLNKSGFTLTNWGVFAHGNQMSTPGTFKNYGVATINGFNVDNKGVLENYGDFNVSGHMNNNSEIYNYGSIEVTGHYNNNGQCILENYCQMIVNGNFAQNNIMHNYGYIYTGAEFRLNGATTNEMYSGAIINCTNIHINSNINGNGTTSGIAVAEVTRINGSGSVTGAMDICDEDGIESNTGTIEESVTFCDAYIPSSSCSPVEYGGAPVLEDADGDGVVDSQDEFPNDEYRAFTSYYISEKGSASILFEDLWPSKGDYDFNDLVLGVSGYQILNADNKVVEITLDFKVRAVGAANINGFGVQFSKLLTSAVKSVDGAVYMDGTSIALGNNGTEQGQSKAVVVVVENVEEVISRAGGTMFNTVKNGFTGTSDTVELKIVFGENSPVDNDLITFSDLDIFLICNQERGWEIHAADVVPTALMSDFWGNADDTSDPSTGRYFKTNNNLPWALVIMDDFKYPAEKVSILDAYPDFLEWAQTGGASNQNWFLNPVDSKVW